ncbi:DnaJ domain protein [hydrothermal vent metagenome]|uniref:DnaJ domain protein n=1 Tax=hydrothermal vent metagenome TaxID=652676 RepID=A0A3B0XBZ0_9ZZZZ
MSRLIVLLILLLLAGYIIYRLRWLSVEQKKRYLKLAAITGGIALLVVLTLTGKLNWLLAGVGALLALLPKVARLLMGAWPRISPYFNRYQQNKHSSMQTQFIHLQVSLITGELQGEVLQGKHKGEKLQLMSLAQLLSLLDECREGDSASALLLASYLDRTHAGWSGDEAEEFKPSGADAEMGQQQARDILGVPASATKKDINKAHKRLMQKLHPDRGGSDYLAQQINQARDLLLKNVG